MIITLLVASSVVFFVLEILPGDPAAVMLGINAEDDTLAALRAELGLDRPIAIRYLGWLGDLVQGDLGIIFKIKSLLKHFNALKNSTTAH